MECASTSECADDVCACLSGPCWDVCLDQHGNGLAEYVNGGEDSQCCQDNTCAGQEFATFYVQITVEGVTESDIGGEEMNAFKDAFVSSSDGLVDHQDIVDVHVSTIEVNSFGQNDDDRRRLAEAVLLEFVVEKPTDEMGSPDRCVCCDCSCRSCATLVASLLSFLLFSSSPQVRGGARGADLQKGRRWRLCAKGRPGVRRRPHGRGRARSLGRDRRARRARGRIVRD